MGIKNNHKKKRIVIAGIYEIHNAGEDFLAGCIEYLLHHNEQNISVETEIVSFAPAKNNLRFFILGGFRKVFRSICQKKWCANITYYLTYWYMKRYFAPYLQKKDALIFGAGSYKFTTQNLWAQYSAAIALAEKKNVPVMLNAMNIQAFQADDARCQILKKYTNYHNVTWFTTRDGEQGLARLKKDYVTNTEIHLAAVGDAGLWIKEAYQKDIVLKEQHKDVVGVNLLRPANFIDYGGHITKEQLIKIYLQLIQKLESENQEWELFSNGLRSDYSFGEIIKNECEKLNIKCVLKEAKNEHELVRMISSYKSIVGARLHACICAYSLGIPFCAYVWDDKFICFGRETGLEELFCREDDLSAEKLYSLLKLSEKKKINLIIKEQLKLDTKRSIEAFIRG